MTPEKSILELLAEINIEIKKYDNVMETVTFNGHWRQLITLLVKKTQLLEQIILRPGNYILCDPDDLMYVEMPLSSSLRQELLEGMEDVKAGRVSEYRASEYEESILTNEDLTTDKGFIEKTSDYIKDKIKKK